MPTLAQFAQRLKMRHDYADMIQARYTHPDGELFDTWISGEEVMARLKTMSREQLIRSFSQMNMSEAKEGLKKELENQKRKQKKGLFNRLADGVEDQLGGNLFGDTLADKIRGVDSNTDAREVEKELWQQRLTEQSFRAVAIELAWINLDGTLPDEAAPEPDDWV